MKPIRNIRYAVLTKKGFINDEATGSAALHATAELAGKTMSPGDQIIPIKNDEELEDYESGRVRLPSLNRHGRR
jgi:hypothetical protein